MPWEREKKENVALAPGPSANGDDCPLPANVVTTPAGVISRTRALPESITYTVLPAAAATPDGPLNAAFVPVPSANADDAPPAKVVTTPAGVMARTRLFHVSAT